MENKGILNGKTVVMVIGGSISCYRTPDIIRDMVKEGAEVKVILSQSASKMIGEQTLEWASQSKVITELTGEMEHISLLARGKEKTSVLVCPATFNMIGAMANGIASSAGETLFANALGMGIDITIVPAMHLEMYENPILERNLDKLKNLGVKIVTPRIEDGKAKIMWSEEIIDSIARKGSNKKSILIISGHSTIPLDPARRIMNRSSGKTGIAISREAYRKGYDSIVYIGNSKYRIPSYVEWRECEETDDFYKLALEATVKNKYDVITIPAALSDFTTNFSSEKLSSTNEITIRLKPREKLIEKICKILEEKQSDTKIVKFKLNKENNNPEDSNFFTVINYLEDSPFDEGNNRYTIVDSGKVIFSGKINKSELSKKIIEAVE